MNKDDIKTLLFAYEVNGYIVAAQTRVAGMKAENAIKKAIDSSPAYNETKFNDEAEYITSYARKLQAIRGTL